jgi:CRP-like cAMP-binding protein
MANVTNPTALRLRGLSDIDAPVALVAALVAASRIVRARKGQIVLENGVHSEDVFLIRSGRVRVELLGVEGREIVMRDLLPGQFFGELASIDSGRRSASITAMQASELLLVPAHAFRDAIATTPEAATWFFGHLAALVRNLTDRVFEMSALNVKGRIHCQLVRMAAAAGVADNQSVIEPFPTHEELAALVGTHREAVTRELSYLSGNGFIVVQRGRLEIVKFVELSMLAQRARGGKV